MIRPAAWRSPPAPPWSGRCCAGARTPPGPRPRTGPRCPPWANAGCTGRTWLGRSLGGLEVVGDRLLHPGEQGVADQVVADGDLRQVGQLRAPAGAGSGGSGRARRSPACRTARRLRRCGSPWPAPAPGRPGGRRRRRARCRSRSGPRRCPRRRARWPVARLHEQADPDAFLPSRATTGASRKAHWATAQPWLLVTSPGLTGTRVHWVGLHSSTRSRNSSRTSPSKLVSTAVTSAGHGPGVLRRDVAAVGPGVHGDPPAPKPTMCPTNAMRSGVPPPLELRRVAILLTLTLSLAMAVLPGVRPPNPFSRQTGLIKNI